MECHSTEGILKLSQPSPKKMPMRLAIEPKPATEMLTGLASLGTPNPSSSHDYVCHHHLRPKPLCSLSDRLGFLAAPVSVAGPARPLAIEFLSMNRCQLLADVHPIIEAGWNDSTMAGLVRYFSRGLFCRQALLSPCPLKRPPD